jgi:hypothetical protein
MIRDIIVTTPKSQMKIAEQEALECLEAIQNGEEAAYFRTFSKKPKDLDIGSRIFYVEDGFIRGFVTVKKIGKGNIQCSTTGKNWKGECYVLMPAQNWKWIKPIVMKGFQGYRYFQAPKDMEIVGDWLDPKPIT